MYLTRTFIHLVAPCLWHAARTFPSADLCHAACLPHSCCVMLHVSCPTIVISQINSHRRPLHQLLTELSKLTLARATCLSTASFPKDCKKWTSSSPEVPSSQPKLDPAADTHRWNSRMRRRWQTGCSRSKPRNPCRRRRPE